MLPHPACSPVGGVDGVKYWCPMQKNSGSLWEMMDTGVHPSLFQYWKKGLVMVLDCTIRSSGSVIYLCRPVIVVCCLMHLWIEEMRCRTFHGSFNSEHFSAFISRWHAWFLGFSVQGGEEIASPSISKASSIFHPRSNWNMTEPALTCHKSKYRAQALTTQRLL